MRKIQFIESELYHIYNRGVDKREIFAEEVDYLRFVHNLFEFNDNNSVSNLGYYINKSNSEFFPRKKPRELLVEILIFTLMPNHFHLILRPKTEKGIEKFMQKLGTGYSMYFNQKYKRSGALFQGRFKAKIINKDSYYSHLPFYIHANPLKIYGIYRGSTSIDLLKDYQWSSFKDYIGIKNFPSVTSRELFLNHFGGEEEYQKAFLDWLNNFKSMESIEVEPQ